MRKGNEKDRTVEAGKVDSGGADLVSFTTLPAVLPEESGLTGRSGAAFSTATKVAATHDHRAGLIVNG